MSNPSCNYTVRQSKEDYKFTCILYPDSTDYDCDYLLNKLTSGIWNRYYYILHDRDTYDAEEFNNFILDNPNTECPFTIGQLKKPHYHVIAVSKHPIKLGLATKKFGLRCTNDDNDQSNYIQRVGEFKKSKSNNSRDVLKCAVQYLIHANNPDKFQYSLNDINYDSQYPPDEYFQDYDKRVAMDTIINYLIDNKITSYIQTVRFCQQHGFYKEIHSMQGIIKNILLENQSCFSYHHRDTENLIRLNQLASNN